MEIEHQRLFNILDWEDDEYETVEEEIINNKHDEVTIILVVKKKEVDEYYSLTYYRSYNEGIRDYGSYDLTPMKKVMRVTYEPK